jgi:hypothetical protein
MQERDFVSEMRTLIDKEAAGEYVSGIVAAEIVGKLRANDPELLLGWLEAQAVTLIHQVINHRDRSRRTHARTAGPRSVFAAAATEHDGGNSATLCDLLATHYVVDGANLRKPLGSMNAADLQFVSARYDQRAADARMEGAFFAALARKVGDGTVSDHFDEAQLRAMRNSLRS